MTIKDERDDPVFKELDMLTNEIPPSTTAEEETEATWILATSRKT